ncbi:MAG: TAXI family TRAP transporter solute-binding subunit [Tissierellia bacterium]|nr:TAXI family TRAP transporter solute-binding subunit [Tissierellia bacterium]
MKRRHMLSFLLSIVIIMTLVVGCGGSEAPADSDDGGEDTEATDSGPVNLDLATMKMGSSWYSYGSVLSELITKELPEGSRVNIIPESGAGANPTLISDGTFPMGLSMNQASSWAYEGKFIFEKPLENLRGLVGYLDTYFYAAVMTKSFGYTDLADVAKDKAPMRVSTGPAGSTGEVATRLIFEYYGFDYDDIISWGGKVEHNDNNTTVELFKDGQADFHMHNVTAGHAALTELAASTDVVFLEFPDELIDDYVEKYGFSREVMPADTFRGQPEAINSMGLTTSLITNTDMSDDIAYAITKAIVENPEAMHKAHAALKRFTPEDAWKPDGLGIPLHPGAEAYYREAGLLK